MDERQDYKLFWTILFGLLLLTRIPVMENYLSIDNVNLAFSLEKFDPRVHQPQPPGYPLFVFFARMVNVFFHDAERTFRVVSLLVSAASVCAAYALAGRIFSPWAGAAAAFLLLVNPAFWQSSISGPLRANLALFSLLTAYCCWRCWNGEKRFVYWGAVALGVGGGFRPDLIVFLLPLWIISSWVGTKSWRSVLRGSALLAAIVLVWTGALLIAMGGIRNFAVVMMSYASEQSARVPMLRQISRLAIWNGWAIAPWIWVIPFCSGKSSSRIGNFFFIWIVPGLVIQALVHVEEPGHTLFSVAALCVLGGYVLSLVQGRDFALGGAILVSAMVFLDFFPLPADASNTANRTPSIKNAVLFGSFETSLEMVRGLDDVTRATLGEIEQFTPQDRPAIIITTDTHVDQWFMNWRIGRYYLPQRDFWVLYDNGKPKRVERIRRDLSLESRQIEPLEIPIFREGRILWLIEPGSAFHQKLAMAQNLGAGKYVFYSDITRDSPAFTIDGVRITPKL
jgi:hypothetical protein